jgi:hypothetical protein
MVGHCSIRVQPDTPVEFRAEGMGSEQHMPAHGPRWATTTTGHDARVERIPARVAHRRDRPMLTWTPTPEPRYQRVIRSALPSLEAEMLASPPDADEAIVISDNGSRYRAGSSRDSISPTTCGGSVASMTSLRASSTRHGSATCSSSCRPSSRWWDLSRFRLPARERVDECRNRPPVQARARRSTAGLPYQG